MTIVLYDGDHQMSSGGPMFSHARHVSGSDALHCSQQYDQRLEFFFFFFLMTTVYIHDDNLI